MSHLILRIRFAGWHSPWQHCATLSAGAECAALQREHCFVVLVSAIYAGLIPWGSSEHGFRCWQVLALDGVIVVWSAVAIFGVLKIV